MKLGIRTKPAEIAAINIKKSFGESFGGWDDIQKAFSHKYIRRIPKKSGKGYWYVYAETFKKPFIALKTFFSMKQERIDQDYDKHSIQKTYGADKKTFAAHILEYLSNRLKWDNIFSFKANRLKYKKPEKQVAATAAVSNANDDTPKPVKGKVLALPKEKAPLAVNRSLMHKVWEIYNPMKVQEAEKIDEDGKEGYIESVEGAENGEGKDNTGTGSQELPMGTETVRVGGGEGAGDLNVPGSGEAGNEGESGGPSLEPGREPGRNIRGKRGRIKDVREQVKKLLSEKKDSEFTEADKELLRQYEGSGGLAEKGASTHGTLYEFYTPQKVVDKVWAIVDKYNPSTDKTVIEPSAGTGRFAENRLEKFDLFELDETSARIAGILHPEANVKQGYFQDLFMNGRTPKKNYDGKKYDVAIGNPPYGEYSGMHRGLGEGKEHTKIDEYFIDRSLDTLNDGGILAMVVPSSFLRGKNSKAKEKIAGKAKILEAWRLPNGTFGTTGVGTDIVVLRKEPGNPEAFNNNAYFEAHGEHIIGVETEKLGRFGMEKYVAPPEGMTFDEALDSINPGKVSFVPVGELEPVIAAMETVGVKVTDAEEHENRSRAMEGNKNAYKGGSKDIDDFLSSPVIKEINKQRPGEWERASRMIYKRYDQNGEIKTLGQIINEFSQYDDFGIDEVGNVIGNGQGIKGGKYGIMYAEYLLKEKENQNAYKGGPRETTRKTVEGIERTFHYGKRDITWEPVVSDSTEEIVTIGDKVVTLDHGEYGYNNHFSVAITSKDKYPAYTEYRHRFEPDRLSNTKAISRGFFEKVVAELKAEETKTGISEAEAHENRSEAMMGNDNAAGSRGGTQAESKRPKKKGSTDDYVRSIGKNMSVDEYNVKYGVKVEKADMPVWAATDYDGRIAVAKLSAADKKHMETSGNFTVDASGTWYSNANYASGNIYDKLDQLERDKEALGEKVYQANKALLEAVKPQPKAADNIHVSPISDFAKEYFITTDEGKQVNLRDAFKQWARVNTWGYGKRAYNSWDSDSSPISEYEIPPNISFNDVLAYINQEPQKADKATAKDFDSDTARMEAAKKREARRECAERLFNRFIREGMPESMRKGLVETWNRRYNAVVNPDYTKIPVFIEGMNTHKGEKEFNLIPEQVRGISFLCNKGNGILAHEVGIGKTIELEAAMVNQINTGRAKRPLTCVPKAVYRKWIKEYHQHFPDVIINELGNFSDKDIAKYKAGETGLNIPEGTISVCTYEALQKITFKDETINTDLIDDMMDSQTIYDTEATEKRTARELAEERNKMMERLGKGAKSKEGALFWEDTGFDCIGIDECHSMKNIFGVTRSFSASAKDPKGKERQSNEFRGLTGGQADRAMKVFAIAQLIQKQNNGRNVFGLSATPFTNSPIEVYNMLSLVARNKLKELHIYNMHEFLAQFAEIKSEWSVSPKGEIVEKEVMKNWKNLGALQSLITEYMDYVEADKAGVMRPRKKVHLPQLEPTPLQRAIIQAETDYMTNADPREDPGATLKAINNMRMATLSPAAINESRWEYYRSKYKELFAGLEIPKPKDFVTSSPKMKFVCDSVSKAYKQLPEAGQIIYLPRGVNDFVHVKQYLMDQGMPADSIAFMSSATSLDEKERIKGDFNNENGKIKVIIGSETIKEGVSLNGNTTTTYNCFLGWNPTETTQVEGRAHRQGNKQGHVHIVYPLMADSIDSLMYQKYDEKSSRINEIWSYKGDTSSDVSDINPEELKFDLIKDPAKKANLIVGQKRDKIRTDRRIEEARYEVLFKDQNNYESAMKRLPEYKRDIDTAEAAMLSRREKRDEAQKVFDKAKKGDDRNAAMDAQRKLDHEKWELEQATSEFRNERKAWKQVQDEVDVYTAKFNKLGIKPEGIEGKLKEIAASINKMKEDEKAIDESYKDELERATRELTAQRQKLPPLNTQIEDNVKSIMGDLRPMDEVKEEIKAERAAKAALNKSFIIWNNRICLKVS